MTTTEQQHREQMRLTAAQADFLSRLRDGRKLAAADDEQDKVRQAMRRAGYAEVVMNPRRWVLTDAGRAALEDEA